MIKPIKPYFLKEASFLSGSLEKVIINMTKIISKRIGSSLIGNPKTVFTVKKPSGYYSGVKYYVGKGGTAIRFNWIIGQNATLHSIDVFRKYKTQPVTTLYIEDLNINQVINAISQHLTTGAVNIDLSESVINELNFKGLMAKFQKAEKEIPQVETATEEVVKKVKIKALTGTQIFDQIARYTEAIVKSTTPKNVLIVAGDPGTGKSVVVTEILNKFAGQPQKPPLRGLPPVGSAQMKKYLKAGEEEKSIQAELRKFSDYIPPAEQAWVRGSQDLSGDELFVEMYQSNGKVLLYDDADNVFLIKENKLLMKQAVDTKPVRPIKLASKLPYVNLGAKVGIIPKEFNYSGRMVIITNKSPGQIDDAILSRALLVDVDLTPTQFMSRLQSLLDVIQRNEAPQISIADFKYVYDWLYDMFINKKVMSKFDIRTYVHLVFEYNILSSDIGLWETIAATAIKQAYPGAKFVISEE